MRTRRYCATVRRRSATPARISVMPLIPIKPAGAPVRGSSEPDTDELLVDAGAGAAAAAGAVAAAGVVVTAVDVCFFFAFFGGDAASGSWYWLSPAPPSASAAAGALAISSAMAMDVTARRGIAPLVAAGPGRSVVRLP